MRNIVRNIESSIHKDIEEKFVFLAGPRQVGKTHLAEKMVHEKGGLYLNWDLPEDRAVILKKEFLSERFVVLDELHKYERWKSFLKGIYDKYHATLKILVTGSARLDVYRRGGDSLFGRHYLHHLHPFSVGELLKEKEVSQPVLDFQKMSIFPQAQMILERLLQYGGFPEPYFKADALAHKRWSVQRRELLVRQDIRDLTTIHMLGLVEHLLLLLPDRVGSVLSINSLKEDLQVAYNTVVQWLKTLEHLYIVYQIKPYTKKINRALHKPAKLYLWDWSQIAEAGPRFENLVASHLLKATRYWQDLGYGEYGLFYLRNSDGREVDFCITQNRKPWFLVECKLSDESLSESLRFFSQVLAVPAFQVMNKEGIHATRNGVHRISASQFLPSLP
jgi:predicted AAA+ superfamily ATPase